MYYIVTFLKSPSNVQEDGTDRYYHLHKQYLYELRPLWWSIVTQVQIDSEYAGNENYYRPSAYDVPPKEENKLLQKNLKQLKDIFSSYFNSDDFVAYLKKRKYTHNFKYIQKAFDILRKIDYTKFWVEVKPGEEDY